MLKFKPETVERNSSNIGPSATIEATVNIIAQCLVPLALYNTQLKCIFTALWDVKKRLEKEYRGAIILVY